MPESTLTLPPRSKSSSIEHASGAGVEGGDEIIVEIDVLGLGALVAELAFDPEHAEVVAADEVDVVAVLPPDPADVAFGDVGGRCGRSSEVDRSEDVLVPWEQDAAFDADIAGAVPGGRRSGDRGRGDCGKKIFAHGQ